MRPKATMTAHQKRETVSTMAKKIESPVKINHHENKKEWCMERVELLRMGSLWMT